jgi:hypothetical protein
MIYLVRDALRSGDCTPAKAAEGEPGKSTPPESWESREPPWCEEDDAEPCEGCTERHEM